MQNMSLSRKKAIDIMKKNTGGKIEEKSITEIPHGFIAVIPEKKQAILVTDGACAFADRLDCAIDEYRYGVRLRFAEMNNKNSQVLRFFLKWTAPSATTGEIPSVGFEDDYGILLPVAAEALLATGTKPVLCSHLESPDKLSLAMGDAAWQALTAGLSGYGSEFSYAKKEQEIMNALLCGYTSIVVDASDKIDYTINTLADHEVQKKFTMLPDEFKEAVKLSYIDKNFEIQGIESFTYTEQEIMRYALVYGEAIAFLQYIYNAYFKSAPWAVDFIIALGQENLPYKAHHLLANEFLRAGVKLAAVEVNPASKDFVNNTHIAKNFSHKLRIVLNEDFNKNLLAESACGFDLRPEKGSGILFVYKLLQEKNDPIITELNLSGLPQDELLQALNKSKESIRPVLVKYYDEYKNSFLENLLEYKNLLK